MIEQQKFVRPTLICLTCKKKYKKQSQWVVRHNIKKHAGSARFREV